MKTTSLDYDPTLGAKFAAESKGLVIGRARSLPKKSEAQVEQDWIEEHGRAPDAQQLHDAMMAASSAPVSAPKASLKERWANMTPQQLGKLFDDLM